MADHHRAGPVALVRASGLYGKSRGNGERRRTAGRAAARASPRRGRSRASPRRAGASLKTLVIDEGFGTQDGDGRDRIVEAINTIEPDFERILVITHIQELKDMFQTQIEISKAVDGSTWSIT